MNVHQRIAGRFPAPTPDDISQAKDGGPKEMWSGQVEKAIRGLVPVLRKYGSDDIASLLIILHSEVAAGMKDEMPQRQIRRGAFGWYADAEEEPCEA